VLAAGINSFYDYLFGAMRSLDRSSAIASLPPQLRMQLLVAINMRTLSNVPLFKHCDIRTMISIVERMQMAIYCPGEMMVREGTPGKAIFLINHGTAHVVRAGQVVVVLSDHEFFGEQSIITETLCTASVRAVTYCDMAILMQEHFQQVCQLFPDLVGQLQRVSVERISATTRIATNRESSDLGTIAAKEAEWEQVVNKHSMGKRTVTSRNAMRRPSSTARIVARVAVAANRFRNASSPPEHDGRTRRLARLPSAASGGATVASLRAEPAPQARNLEPQPDTTTLAASRAE